ncbi:MarR family winged helix-turn-helix transcriptional regulator [Brucella sp. 2716]|uniref:MarR family winged helix-turn-helix transcriptional regulator n=1 Tax=Brucella sp. 2716 TaxID=2975052 RepID=UPI00217E799E|nr:MarR family winged helix-turn-helix transcriptional regulator [Brucella sp. 2716]UWF59828.1 MarR family winged helix-turn-helix transcriptional regulator [Brucella sp. 2716]
MTASDKADQAEHNLVARKLTRVLDLFQGENTKMQINLLQTFLHIKANPGIPFKKLELLMDLTNASVSRNVATLTDEGYKKRDGTRDEGMGLVVTREIPTDKSSKAATLTPKGEALFDEFIRILRSGENGSKTTR